MKTTPRDLYQATVIAKLLKPHLFLRERVSIERMDVEFKKAQGVFLCVAYCPHSHSELSHSEVF
jgi:hypothetical protein